MDVSVSLTDDDTHTSAFKRGLQKFAMHSPSSNYSYSQSQSQATSVQSKSFEHDVAYSDDEDEDGDGVAAAEMKAARAAWRSRKACANRDAATGSVAGKFLYFLFYFIVLYLKF